MKSRLDRLIATHIKPALQRAKQVVHPPIAPDGLTVGWVVLKSGQPLRTRDNTHRVSAKTYRHLGHARRVADRCLAEVYPLFIPRPASIQRAPSETPVGFVVMKQGALVRTGRSSGRNKTPTAKLYRHAGQARNVAKAADATVFVAYVRAADVAPKRN